MKQDAAAPPEPVARVPVERPPSNLPPQAGEGFFVHGLGLTAFLILAASALVSIYAALELRPLFADGFHYFLRILERETFWLEAPARRTVELIRQLPVLAALKLGAGDTPALAVIFGLSIELLPLALVALCWPALPRGRKHFFAFPLLHYCAGTLGAAFSPIVEGPAAAAYFWLLLFLLLFRSPRGGGLVLMAILAAGTLLLHEGMVLLAPLLAAVALWRAWRGGGQRDRIVFAGLALWFAVVIAVQVNFIADPSHPANRTLYVTALFSFWWLYGLGGSLNLPALFGIAGLVILLADCVLRFMRRGTAPPRGFIWVHAAFGAAILAAVIDAIASDRIFAAQAQLNARNHPILISLPLAAIAFFIAAKPAAAALLPFRGAVIVSASLAAASIVWNIDAVRRWSDYVETFRAVLGQNRGLVAWEDVRAKLPPAQARLFEGFSHFWIEPTMSIVLAPGGRVATIVAPRRAARWYPFDARKPEELPRARLWNFDDFLAALSSQR
jgi:hypothetical protein